MQAFIECGDYFKELSEYKSKQLAGGVSAGKGTMDLMGKSPRHKQKQTPNTRSTSCESLGD
jgi:hypothetical protein